MEEDAYRWESLFLDLFEGIGYDNGELKWKFPLS